MVFQLMKCDISQSPSLYIKYQMLVVMAGAGIKGIGSRMLGQGCRDKGLGSRVGSADPRRVCNNYDGLLAAGGEA